MLTLNLDSFAAPQTNDKNCKVQEHCPTEELCRKAAQKLTDYCITAQDGESTELRDKGESGEKTSSPISKSVPSVGDDHDPKPCTVLVETAQQIPLERADTTMSFVIPPPPPSSPGDALAATHSERHNHNNAPHIRETPFPQPPNCPYVARSPLLYQSPPYTVTTTDPPPAVSVQPTQPGPPPTQVTNVNNTDVHQTQVSYCGMQAEFDSLDHFYIKTPLVKPGFLALHSYSLCFSCQCVCVCVSGWMGR